MHRKYKWGAFFIAAVLTIFTWAIPLQTVSAEKDSERFVDTQNDSKELDTVETPTQALLSLKDSENDEGAEGQAPEENQSDDAEELDSPEVYFEDAVLKKVIAKELGIDGRAITEADMTKLTNLYANGYDSERITSLEGLQYATNLVDLSLWDNNISELTPISGLENISYLDLDDNNIEDLTPLTNLTNLMTLYLDNNAIEDITPLQELSLMDMYISLYGNYFDDRETIQYLRDNGATVNYDWEEEEESPEVYFEDGVLEAAIAEELGIEGRPITEEDMAKLTELTSYGTGSEPINSLEGLQYAENLRELNLMSNTIRDLTPLSNLVNLEELTLWDNDVSDITPLENLRNLSYLDLDNNAIEDLTPLSDLKNLETLHLDDNAINDITPLKELSLKDMYISLYGNNFNDDDTIQYLRDNGAIVGYYSTESDKEDETETPDPDDGSTDSEGDTPNPEGSGGENGETNGYTPAPEDNEGGNGEQENNTPAPENDDGENEGSKEETPNSEENKEGTGNSENETPTPAENEEGTGNTEDDTPAPTEAESGNGEANNAASNATGTTGGSGESGNNSTAQESQSDVRGESTAEKLPNTSTNAYNWFLAVAVFLFAGSYMLIFYAYRNRRLKHG